MKMNQSTLDKFEDIIKQGEYTVRYEKGSFQSGWCVLEEKRVVVLNKFLDVEGKINTLLDLIPQLDINYDKLTLESQKLYDNTKQKIVAPELFKA